MAEDNTNKGNSTLVENKPTADTSEDKVFKSADEWRKEYLPETYEREEITRIIQSDENSFEKRLRKASNAR